MAAGCWAVPAVPTGSRLSSGRPAVTALVPLRNLLGHRALPAKISARVSDDGAMRGEWSYRRLRPGHRPESDGPMLGVSETRSCPNRKRSRRVTAAVSPASSSSRRGGRRAAGLAWGRRRRDERLPRQTGRGRAARWCPSTAPATGRAGRNGWPALSHRSPPSSRRAPRSPAPSRRLRRAGGVLNLVQTGGSECAPISTHWAVIETLPPASLEWWAAHARASRRSCPPRKRPGAGSDFGRSSRWPGAAGWRPRGGGAARPARGIARKLPAASGATIWPLYA